MSATTRCVHRLASLPLRLGHRQQQSFTTTSTRLTDGVYTELTAMRTRTPFVDAFRRQQEGAKSVMKAIAPKTPSKPDVTPKKMQDSYHSVVCHVRHIFTCTHIDMLRLFPLAEIHGSWTTISTPVATSGLARYSWTLTLWPALLLTSIPGNLS